MRISTYTSSESLCKWIFEFAEFGIILTDADLNITDVNSWIEKKTGKGRLTLVGNSILESFPEISERGLEQYLRNAVAGASVILSARFHDFFIRIPVHGGDEPEDMKQTVRISALSNNSSVYGLIIHIEDVSERFRNGELMQKKNEELQKLNSTKDRFFRIISHDLRSPFSAMLGFSQLLRDDETITSEHARNNINILYSAIQKQYDFLENLLKWAQLRSGKFEAVFEDINLFDLINYIIETAAPLTETKKIEIRTSCVPEDMIINTDKQALMTILYNLVLNAMEVVSDQPDARRTVAISVDAVADDVVAAVSDRGPGIAPEDLPHVFDPFFTTKPGGMGLGLPIARTLVEGMGGEIRVESRPGDGATFRVRLPLLPAPAAAAGGAP
jgi:signal transduction histidine kinase